MPGHIGTDIVLNSLQVARQARPRGHDRGQLAEVRDAHGPARPARRPACDDDIAAAMQLHGRACSATTRRCRAAQAATIILDGVRDEWRILVGEDAHALDRLVRE